MTSKSMRIRRARAFHVNLVIDVSAKSRKEIHVVAIDVNVEYNVSEGGGMFPKNTCKSEQSFWR